MTFTRSLPGAIRTPSGEQLKPIDLVDVDLCWAFDLAGPGLPSTCNPVVPGWGVCFCLRRVGPRHENIIAP